MNGGLYDPLGAGPSAVAPRWRPSFGLITAGTISAALMVFGIVVALRGGDERGDPHAVVTIERSSPSAPLAVTAVPVSAVAPPIAPPQPAPPAVPAPPGDADVEVQNGVRIIRMRSQPTRPAAQGTMVPPAAGVLSKGLEGMPSAGTR